MGRCSPTPVKYFGPIMCCRGEKPCRQFQSPTNLARQLSARDPGCRRQCVEAFKRTYQSRVDPRWWRGLEKEQETDVRVVELFVKILLLLKVERVRNFWILEIDALRLGLEAAFGNQSDVAGMVRDML